MQAASKPGSSTRQAISASAVLPDAVVLAVVVNTRDCPAGNGPAFCSPFEIAPKAARSPTPEGLTEVKANGEVTGTETRTSPTSTLPIFDTVARIVRPPARLISHPEPCGL